MIKISNAKLNEKMLIRKVEKATFATLCQTNFFSTDIAIVCEYAIKQQNNGARGVDSVTDVLSFPSFDKLHLPCTKHDFLSHDFDGKKVFLGSIMICRSRAIEQSSEYGHDYQRELGFLACHGFLHLLGFDHVDKEDEKVMFALQKSIMDIVGLKR